MKSNTNNKRAYLVFGVILAAPMVTTVIIFGQLYATMMRFS